MKKSALRAISWVALLTLVAKGLGMVRDILQARAFGTTAEVDLFTAANNSTIYLFTTAAYALCLAAVPIFAQKLAKDRAQAFRTADNLLSVTLLVSLAVTAVVLLLGASGLLGHATGNSGHSFRWYVTVMALTLPLIVVTYLLMALFQAMGHYSLQGSLSLLYNVALCGLLLFVGSRMSVAAFAVVSSVAWVLQLAMTLPYLVKERYRFHFRLDLKADYLPLYLRTAVVTAFTTAIFLFCYLLDTNMAAPLGEGVTSAFYYADKLFTPVITTLIYSIGAVMFPKWSERHATMEDGAYRAYVGEVVEGTILLLLPLSAVFSVFGIPIIRVLFEGGSFTADSTSLTGMVFARYALGMVGFALLDLLAKAYYAMHDTRAPLLVNLGVLGGNFLLNLLLMALCPTPGALAVATALMLTLGGVVLLLLFLRGKVRGVLHPLRLLAGAVLSVILYVGLALASNALLGVADGKLMLVVKCGALGAVALGIYLLLMGRACLASFSRS